MHRLLKVDGVENLDVVTMFQQGIATLDDNAAFVADEEEMKVEIAYTFNASALGGKNLVTFEELETE